METVAVLGASGFIGTRLVEMLHLGAGWAVRPVVRCAASAARLSRFSLDCRVADARDEEALAAVLEGCRAVVHAISGSPEVILAAIRPVCDAAKRAGVRRLIYLSSASVHGQAPEPGTTEESPLSDKQPVAYNTAKVEAERLLRRCLTPGQLELVILRPGIVFGPRSFWIGSFADALLAGKAYLIADGRGICNSIYVDNLVHAIRLAISADGITGEAFLLGDREQVTWMDLYRPVAEALGFDLSQVVRVAPRFRNEQPNRLQRLRSSTFTEMVRPVLPATLRRVVSAGVRALQHPVVRPSPWEELPQAEPQPTLEMSLLHSCRYKLPHDKAERLLGYEPLISFAEGCRRTVEWMAFAGYPVKRSTPCQGAS